MHQKSCRLHWIIIFRKFWKYTCAVALYINIKYSILYMFIIIWNYLDSTIRWRQGAIKMNIAPKRMQISGPWDLISDFLTFHDIYLLIYPSWSYFFYCFFGVCFFFYCFFVFDTYYRRFYFFPVEDVVTGVIYS